jgi:hypothetical protein
MKTCIKCGSHAFNLYAEGIDQGGLCDVHYWQGRARRAEALAQPPLPVQEPVAGLHAVYFQNNWDGQENREYVLAHLSEKGEWTHHENGAPLIEFEGDEIIKTWPITFEGTSPPQRPHEVDAYIDVVMKGQP